MIKGVLAGRTISDEWLLPSFSERIRQTRKLLDPYKMMAGVMTVDPSAKLMKGDRVVIRSKGRLLYRDDNHLSVAGSLYLKDLLEPIFQKGPGE